MNYWNEGSSIEQKCRTANEKLKDVLQYQKEEQTFCREVQRIFDLIFTGSSASIYTAKPEEQVAIINFLSPDGLLFQAITRFMTYDNFRFNFQLIYAPLTIQAIISNKSSRKMPEFFASKIRRTETIELNIFELYFCYFAYGCAVWNSNNKKTLVCYKELLRRYMKHFFSSQLTAQHSNKISPGHVFLQIIIHFWFNQNSMELYSKRTFVPPNIAVVEAIHEITEFFIGENPLYNLNGYEQYGWQKEKVQIMNTIQDMIYPVLFEFLKVNFTAAADSQVSQNVALFFEQVEIWLLVLSPWKYVDEIAKKNATSLMPKLTQEVNFFSSAVSSIATGTGKLFGKDKPESKLGQSQTAESDGHNDKKQIQPDYQALAKSYVFNSIVFYAPLLEIFLKRYSSVMLNNLNDENRKLFKACEAISELKEYVNQADELITRINLMPSYDRPTQGEGAVICKSLGLIGTSYQSLQAIAHPKDERENLPLSVINKLKSQNRPDSQELIKTISDLFNIPVDTAPTTSTEKIQEKSPQSQRNAYEDENGQLTEYGKDMLRRGVYHCSKKVSFTGDSRFQPTRTFEIDWLVNFTSELSRRMEDTYGTVLDVRWVANQWFVVFAVFVLSFFVKWSLFDSYGIYIPAIALLFFIFLRK
jgi:hypothetical protein